MKDRDYKNLIKLANVGGGFVPANEAAQELLDQTFKGEILEFKEVTARDIKFHRGYFLLLGYIWDFLPKRFQKQVSKENFYKWLKHLKGEYEVLYTYKDGTKLIEYDSISFGNMSQKEFEIYVKMQLPYIYEYVIGAFFEGELYNSIVQNIENEFENYLKKLQ